MPDSWRNGGSVAFVELDRPDPESRTRVLCYAGHEMAKYLKWTSFFAVEHFERNIVQSRELTHHLPFRAGLNFSSSDITHLQACRPE
jgi:hypothetical protein